VFTVGRTNALGMRSSLRSSKEMKKASAQGVCKATRTSLRSRGNELRGGGVVAGDLLG
jgi:hypothetical protein